MSSNAFLDDLLDLAGQPERLDDAIHAALDELGRLVPYDLAAYFEWRQEAFQPRVLRGSLAEAARAAGGGRVLDPRELPSIERAFARGGPWVLSEAEHEAEGDPWDGVLDLPHGHSCLLLPVQAAGERLGLITMDRQACGPYEDPAVGIAGLTARILAQAVLFARQAARLHELSALLEERNRSYRESRTGECHAVAWLESSRSPAMITVREQARQAAASDAPVLISGETGSGKEVLARAIHEWSLRRGRPFLAVNCAALPSQLAESELFGHVRGAFTGAVRDRPGLFVAVEGGTLLLDEVGDLPLEVQAKLLRALQERTVTPVGTSAPRPVDLRIVAASHLDLAEAVRAGRFREDLFFRLHVVPLLLPPLRDRTEDLELLARTILAELARGRVARWHLARDVPDWLAAQPWPGNIRQLRNVLERATIFSGDGWITRRLLEEGAGAAASPRKRYPGQDEDILPTLENWERDYIVRVLERCGGRVYGPGGAAQVLGLKPTTLQSRMKKLGLRRRHLTD
ncbi:MAG: sigma 54-interacting transcriptional regulator [bacterium]|jgi:transcriptional regulator with GAF, ATPase, and Fis domain|nr:sigma 54-interacting transcriptional regulator [bacterium]